MAVKKKINQNPVVNNLQTQQGAPPAPKASSSNPADIKSIAPSLAFDSSGNVTARVGEQTWNFTKDQYKTLNTKKGIITPEMNAYLEANAKNQLLQQGNVSKLQDLAQKENIRNYIMNQLGRGMTYSELMSEIAKGKIGNQPENLTMEQLESEIPKSDFKPMNAEDVGQSVLNPLVKSPLGIAGMTTQKPLEQTAGLLQGLDIVRQWTKQIPGISAIAGKGGASTVESTKEAWAATTKQLDMDIANIKTGDKNYRDALNEISDVQNAMLQYEGYIHGIGQADPDYRIDNGFAMEQKLKYYQETLHDYKLQVIAAENARRTKIAQLENIELYGQAGVPGTLDPRQIGTMGTEENANEAA